MDQVEIRYAEKFWALGNGVAAFAIVQDLAFALSFPQSLYYCAMLERKGLAVILFIGIAFSFLLYVLGIMVCAWQERKLLGVSQTASLSHSITMAIRLRCSAVLFMTIILFALTYDVWLNPVLGAQPPDAPKFCMDFE